MVEEVHAAVAEEVVGITKVVTVDVQGEEVDPCRSGLQE